ncbi:MAG: amylo-alpha-1,6-glucosidase [Rhodocyclaceae bacterium]|nr:amylo-alpha-1,6-glucosidase [Rhodocyclaceae bacterium]
MPEEIIQVNDGYYIRSTSAHLDDRTRVLKHGDTFAVFDRFGDIEVFGTGELGIYHQDTRFLSRLMLKIEGKRPHLLSSTIRSDNIILTVDAINLDIGRGDEVTVPRGSVHIFRSKLLWNGTCHERVRIHSYAGTSVDFHMSLVFGADFTDVFEVRGTHRPRRGKRLPARADNAAVRYFYEGLDGRARCTHLTFDPAPTQLNEGEARYDVHIAPGEEIEYRYAVACEVNDMALDEGTYSVTNRFAADTPQRYDAAVQDATTALDHARAGDPNVFTSNEQFNDWLNRSIADLYMMRTDTVHGPYPYAGVPWFCAPFGRDGIITALECLSFYPELARGVLTYLAAHQADEESAANDAEPGKLLHEARAGEMAAVGEVPFKHYYGSIDATPLFVMLAGAYYERSGDAAFVRAMWPHVQRALTWIDKFGDLDGDGFVEYARRSEHGLVNQGWKDSFDSVFHADGTLAEAPIALCEVQGYVYAAKVAAGRLAAALGDETKAQALANEADVLQRRFETAFWCEDLSTYALALDGDKRPCRVRTSNAGHCLLTGIASEDHARRVAATLLADASFSGWGVRTVATGEPRYNPVSYHNGSIWPHDNAMIAAGLAAYDHKAAAGKILTGLLDSSLFFDLHRMPELFSGFHRRSGEAPTLYPVACAPQSWAAGAVFLILESCLGLKVQGRRGRIVFSKPYLPESLKRVSIRRLRVGNAFVDLLATRHDEGDVGVNVLRRDGAVEVVILK